MVSKAQLVHNAKRLLIKCFFTANGGLFERPSAAFFTVVAAGVMPCMTVVMVVTMRRKTRFPTGVTTSATKAKPPAVATAFCVFGITLYNIRGCGICHRPADLSAAVTPSANRNTYSVATFFLSIPRVEVLRPSTLGYEIATPTELLEGSPILAFLKGKEHNVNGFVYEWTFVLS